MKIKKKQTKLKMRKRTEQFFTFLLAFIIAIFTVLSSTLQRAAVAQLKKSD